MAAQTLTHRLSLLDAAGRRRKAGTVGLDVSPGAVVPVPVLLAPGVVASGAEVEEDSLAG